LILGWHHLFLQFCYDFCCIIARSDHQNFSITISRILLFHLFQLLAEVQYKKTKHVDCIIYLHVCSTTFFWAKTPAAKVNQPQ